MKSFLNFLTPLVFIISIYSCNRTINGEGPVITEKRTVDHITGIELSIPAKVTLIEADSFTCTIGAQKNILENIKTSLSGDELVIESDVNFNTDNPVQIVISMPGVNTLKVNGSGEITGLNNIHDKSLELAINGSGLIKLKGKMLDVESNIKGSGEIYLEGKCDQHQSDINGSGELHAFNLESANTSVEISGSGDAEVNVSDELKVNINGSGNVYYKGNPHIKSDISGSGIVQKK